MEFVSVRDFNSSPQKAREILSKQGKMVLTNSGQPAMLVFDITGQDVESLIDRLNRAEAMRLLEDMQMQSARSALDTILLDEINTEIDAYRKEKRCV